MSTSPSSLTPSDSPRIWQRLSVQVLIGLVILLAGMFLGVRIGSGEFSISSSEIIRWLLGREIDAQHQIVLRSLRGPRVLLAVLSGGVLATAGVVYQALLRNPLAGPYTLGVSGGATFGAVLAIALSGGIQQGFAASGLPVVSVSALVGAGFAIGLIYFITRSAQRFSTSTIVLAGVTLNLIFASLILLLQYLADFTQVYQMIRWMMGGLDIDFRDYWFLFPVSLLGWGFVLFSLRELDLLAVDPLAAATLGVKVESIRWRLLVVVSLMTGAVVAFIGPIGFVGLIVPHTVRMFVGASHRRVLPISIIAGGLFLMACDTLAQNILGTEEIPVGVITSMIGGPFFVFLLLRGKGSASTWGD